MGSGNAALKGISFQGKYRTCFKTRPSGSFWCL